MIPDESLHIKLSQFSHAAGCGCKLPPADLTEILSGIRQNQAFPNLLVGNESNEDACVWNLGNGTSIVSTVDFFMPIVDDAFLYGKISAANALSDIYAMGAQPSFANAILGWPLKKLPNHLAKEVLKGAIEICKEAGIPLAGGHSIDSPEPFFGLCVNGIINNDKIKKNAYAQSGDYLFLTKALGTGVLTTALKKGKCQESEIKSAIDSMCQLNTIGLHAAKINGVNAMTDITGFGFLGHLSEMMEASATSAIIYPSLINKFPLVETFIQSGILPDNTYRNWNMLEKQVENMQNPIDFALLNDPQSSGGLLISVNESGKDQLCELLAANNFHDFIMPIGKVIEKSNFVIKLEYKQ